MTGASSQSGMHHSSALPRSALRLVRRGRTLNLSCTDNLAPAEVTILDTLLVGAVALAAQPLEQHCPAHVLL
jgi:hypothetical protein